MRAPLLFLGQSPRQRPLCVRKASTLLGLRSFARALTDCFRKPGAGAHSSDDTAPGGEFCS